MVEDNGAGIPAEEMENIFSPFVSTKESRGTGLGLPVSQKILKEHGGRIRVESKPGDGEPVHPRIPRRAARQQRRSNAVQIETMH